MRWYLSSHVCCIPSGEELCQLTTLVTFANYTGSDRNSCRIWRQHGSGRRTSQLVNILELASLLTYLRPLPARDEISSCRMFLVLDSLVEASLAARDRSSCFFFLTRLCRLLTSIELGVSSMCSPSGLFLIGLSVTRAPASWSRRMMAVRFRARRKRGHLRRVGIQLKIRQRYLLAGTRGFFLTSCELFALSLPRTAKEFNELLGGCVNFLHQDDGDIQHAADVVAAALRPCFPRLNINRATLRQKLAMHKRSLPRHTPSCGSGPLDGDLIFATSVLLGFVAVLRTGEILPINWVHDHWCPAS